MKLVLRAVTALALVAAATPAFPCNEKTESHAAAPVSDAKTAVAKAEKKDAAKKAPQATAKTPST
jgi:hypothetical protein